MATKKAKATKTKKANAPEKRSPLGTQANARPKSARGRTTATETPLAFRVRDKNAPAALTEYVRDRAGLKLGKLAIDLDRLSVRLEEVGGSKGAPMHVCRVKAVLSLHESVIVSVADADPRAAVDGGLEVAERAILRALERNRSKRRR
jgi:hypothetical protein